MYLLNQLGPSRYPVPIVPLVKFIPLAEFPSGSLTQLQINRSSYALCNADATVRCFDGVCPKAGGPLGDGNLDKHQSVGPWHRWAFDCETGINDFDPSIQIGDSSRPHHPCRRHFC
jgi:nitrite reductase/ring-hydroxylating ferredoxin subunit